MDRIPTNSASFDAGSTSDSASVTHHESGPVHLVDYEKANRTVLMVTVPNKEDPNKKVLESHLDTWDLAGWPMPAELGKSNHLELRWVGNAGGIG
jgi:hypothetical protein